MQIVDSHAHLDDPHLGSQLDDVLTRAAAAQVTRVLAVGTTAESSGQCVQLAEQYPGVWAAVGIQPNHVAEAAAEDWDRILALVEHPRVCAIGETGLDCYWDRAPLDLQRDYFDRHLRLSQQLDRAVVIHLRESEGELLEMLREARQRGPLRGVMHSYTGTAAGLAEFLELGLYISFAGMVTFKKDDGLRQIAAAVPLDRLLVETDSPYLSPEPLRGQRPNEPARVVHTLNCLAAVHGISAETMADRTTENAYRLFGWSS